MRTVRSRDPSYQRWLGKWLPQCHIQSVLKGLVLCGLFTALVMRPAPELSLWTNYRCLLLSYHQHWSAARRDLALFLLCLQGQEGARYRECR